ncbi:MAG: hypothetical protein N4A72_20385 [Bacteroidales bacterium]|jgi:hypothetical protein|nr:hypothetical protein [Bacteroidales bacterium]
MYKSSPFTSLLKKVIPVLIVIVASAAIYMAINTNNIMTQKHIMVIFSLFLMPMIVSIIKSQRLKDIVTEENGIEIKSSGKKETILYKDIEYILISDPFTPWAITLKYYDKKLRKHKLVSYIPNHKYRVKGELDIMRRHIEDKFVEENPKFSKKKQPKSVRVSLIPSFISIAIMMTSFIIYSMW